MGTLRVPAILSRIRQNTDGRILFLEACGAVYSFTAGAFGPQLELLGAVSDLPRLLVPVTVVISVFLLRNGYRRSEDRNYTASFADVVLAGVAAFLSQLALSHFYPEWVMPRWAPTQGGFVGFCFVAVVRSLFPPGPQERAAALRREVLSIDRIQWRAVELEKQIRKRNVVAAIIAVSVVALFALGFFYSTWSAVRVGCVGFMLFAAAMAVGLRTAGAPTKAPPRGSAEYQTFYREELKRQYRFLVSVWLGLAGLVLPACALILLRTHVYEFVVFIYLLLFAELVLREAEWFQRELCQLDVTGGQPD